MQPQYPGQPPMPQYPQQPPQGYPAPQPTYPPQQYPQQPQGYPVQPAYPQAYAQPQQYAPPAPPAVPLPTGTLDTFYQQPSGGGGPSFKFMDANRMPQIGKSYVGIVARPVTDSDIRAQTDKNGQVQTYKDGRPKFVMVVPMQVQPDQEFPEGQAGWWVKGQARDELARAMAEAGAPAGAPEAGAGIRVTLVSTRPVPGYNPQYQYRVEYMRPNGAAPAPAPVASPPQQPAPAMPVQQQAPQPYPQPAPVMHQAPPVPPQQPAPAPVQAAAPTAAPAGFNPEQAALFAKLTGQPAS